MKIREILRLRDLNLSIRQIASSPTVNCARSSLQDLLKRCERLELDFEESKKYTDQELEALVYPNKHKAGPAKQGLDSEHWCKRQAESGKTLLDLWQQEYLVKHPEGLSYAQFCYRLRQWRLQNAQDLSYPKQRKAGQVMETDWCGDKLAILYSKELKKNLEVHFFVASIGFSQKIFVRGYLDEKEESWIDAHTRALEYFTALPEQVKPDNTKTAINKANRYEPDINPSYSQWASHWSYVKKKQ